MLNVCVKDGGKMVVGCELGWFIARIDELKTIERKLHRIDERNCSENMNEGQILRIQNKEARLLARATEIAESLGLAVYHQGDCRGNSLYLVPKGKKIDDSNYNSEGVCL